MIRYRWVFAFGVLMGAILMLYACSDPSGHAGQAQRSTGQQGQQTRPSTDQATQLSTVQHDETTQLSTTQHIQQNPPLPPDKYGPQDLPPYQARMYEDNLDCPLFSSVYGNCYLASTQATDTDSLALITEDVYEKSKTKYKNLGRPDMIRPAIRVGFFHPGSESTFATGFYFSDKDLVDQALTDDEVSTAKVEGRVYVFSGGDVGDF